MARTVRQGGQVVFVFSDAEASALHAAVVAFDLEPANTEDWAPAERATFDRVADAIIPNRGK